MKKTTQRMIIFISLIAVVALFSYFLKDILIPYIRMEIANDLDGAKALLVSKGVWGFMTVVLVEALQMIVVFIPAEFIQISSGMSYPFYIAILLCDLGVCLGASIIYALVRIFRFHNDTFDKKEELIEKLAASSKKERSTVLLLYFLFIMPIIPFGAICYYGSSRRIRYGRYLFTVATGVIPSIVTSNLMGAATKYFISNDMPLPLLLLIIVLLGALLFIALFIFLDKVYFKENDRTPDSVIYSAFFRLVDLLRRRRQRLHIDDSLIKELKPPYIVLANHESFYDFYYIKQLFKNVNPAYVVNRHYVSSPLIRKLARKAAFIPKRLFTPDMGTVAGILRMTKKGYPIILFPEGRLSIVGRSYPMVENSAALLKKLKQDIVIARIEGAFFANPKWRRRFYKTDISVRASRVITSEELSALSAEELGAILDKELYYDESESPVNPFHQKDKAQGLENVLYRCADCGALYSTKGEGNRFICSECGSVHTFDESYRFTEAPYTIGDYYERIKALEERELDSFALEADVRTVIFNGSGKYRTVEKGHCSLNRERFAYASEKNSFEVPVSELPALPFSCDAEFETYHEEKLYYFYPEKNRRQAARWALLVDLMKEKRDEEKIER